MCYCKLDNLRQLFREYEKWLIFLMEKEGRTFISTCALGTLLQLFLYMPAALVITKIIVVSAATTTTTLQLVQLQRLPKNMNYSTSRKSLVVRAGAKKYFSSSENIHPTKSYEHEQLLCYFLQGILHSIKYISPAQYFFSTTTKKSHCD